MCFFGGGWLGGVVVFGGVGGFWWVGVCLCVCGGLSCCGDCFCIWGLWCGGWGCCGFCGGGVVWVVVWCGWFGVGVWFCFLGLCCGCLCLGCCVVLVWVGWLVWLVAGGGWFVVVGCWAGFGGGGVCLLGPLFRLGVGGFGARVGGVAWACH
ncbi:hypothetical protein RA272_27580 [Pseudomonas syringae pv. tagetis]|uniref:hypothetical protein n=1 Tax=Pseudomonas syringae group genomosp. 7 TaxID=251699 RepID=UPI00376FE970